MRKLILSGWLLCVLCMLFGCKKAEPQKPEPTVKIEFRQDGTLDIANPQGTVKTTFTIEIAEKEEELMQGLKFREKLGDNQGMLFIFEYPDIYEFWMQDTYLPLDMLFIASDGTINYIYENTVPFSEERITPNFTHKFVLEVNAGTVKKYNIQTGDKVTWKRHS